jgi:ABC-type sugar transport system substrate-binding protein
MGQLFAKRAAVPIACVAACMAVAACGSNSSSSAGTGAPAKKGTGSVKGDGKEIVLFSQTRAAPYLVVFDNTVKAEARRLGYKLKIIEVPDVNQTTQDGLVRQFIASGDKPAAIIWWPANVKASAVSARLLSRVAPVFQTGGRVLPESQPYITAYVGPDETTIGANAGKLLMALRDKVKADGARLHDPRGNVLILNFPPGFQPGIDRTAGFRSATASQPFNVIHEESGNYFAPQPAYQNATQLIPKYKDKLDFVLVSTTAAAIGATKALAENGLTPGKNVRVVTFNCDGTYASLTNGQVYGTTLESPSAAGTLSVDTVARYLATGKVRQGTYSYKPDPTPPAVTATPPYQTTYMPLQAVAGKAQFAKANVFGADGPKACAA